MKLASVIPLFLGCIAARAVEAAANEPAAADSEIDITSLLVFGIGVVALVVTYRWNSRAHRRD
jgi:hypothetical protein